VTIEARRMPGTFGALRNERFRWLWLGQLATSATYQMSTVAIGWLVYQLTGSALALGWVTSGSGVAMLVLSLYGGAVSDRIEKRTLLLWARVAMIAHALTLATLIATGAIRIWHLVVLSTLSGALFAFLMPAQQAILAELVDKDTLLNAMSINSVGMGLMGIGAASAAGFVIEAAGVGGVYYVIAGLYVWALFTLTRLPDTGIKATSRGSVLADLRAGLAYARLTPVLMTLLGVALGRVFLAMSYRTLMPKFAEDVLGYGASGLGLLMAMPGVGSLAASLWVASLGDFRGKGRLLLLAGAAMGISLAAFVSFRHIVPVGLFLALVGAGGNVCMVANQTLLQLNCDDAYRGRVMSMYMMVWGLTPLANIPAGAIADQVGTPAVIATQGLLLLLVFGAIHLFRPEISRME